MRENAFVLGVTVHCNRLGKEIVKSPSLDILKTHLGRLIPAAIPAQPAAGGALWVSIQILPAPAILGISTAPAHPNPPVLWNPG